jgi:hypothetical protein
MNAPQLLPSPGLAEPLSAPDDAAGTHDVVRLREIPYNYTSFSDREIVLRLLAPAPGNC